MEALNRIEKQPALVLKPLRDGLRARGVVLPTENRDEFNDLCDNLEHEWRPQTRTEQFYLEQMAVSQWKLARMEAGEVDLFDRFGSTTSKLAELDRYSQCQSRLERSFIRAQREFEHLKKSRPPEIDEPAEITPAPPPPTIASPDVPDKRSNISLVRPKSTNPTPNAQRPTQHPASAIQHPARYPDPRRLNG